MSILRALVFSNAYVALVLTLLTCATYSRVEGLAVRWYVLLSMFLACYLLYTFHRLYKVDFIPESHLGERHRWVLKNAGFAKWSMGVSVLLGFLLLSFYDADTIVWITPAVILSIGYTIPFIPMENKWWRFRDIPFVKPVIIALVVAYLCVAFPIIEQWGIASIAEPQIIGLLVERFLFLLLVTIPFEMRDHDSDQQAGLSTVATVYGIAVARNAMIFSACAWLASIIWQLPALSFTHASGTFLVAGFLTVVAWKWNAQRSELYYAFGFEGAIALISLVDIGTHWAA